ncbi:MAG TPA: tyrosine-type recombinase/integrase [bacterium]|nr:tyrosine-type recombinase/integrase [bacterium]
MGIIKKNGKWIVDYRIEKKRLRKSFSNKNKAESFYYSIKNQKNIQSVNDENLLCEFIETYKNYKFPSVSAGSQKKIKANLQIFLDYIKKSFSEKIKVTGITPKILIDFINEQNKIFAPQTINNRIVYIRELFKFAVDMQIITENPVIVKFVKEKKILPDYYSKEEIEKMITAAKGKMNYYVIINLLLYTGMRKQEMENLKWVHIDFEKNIITIFSSKDFKTKTSRSNRNIPLNLNLKNILLDWKNKELKKSEYVIHTAEGNKDMRVYEKIKYFLLKLGITGDLHKFRHTFASHLINSGVGLYEVSKLLGHTDIKTTMIYSHLCSNFLDNQINKLNFTQSALAVQTTFHI